MTAHSTVTRPAFADKIPPLPPTLLELAENALAAERTLFAAISQAGEYSDKEDAAMNASERFWAALEMKTGLTRKMMENIP